MNGTGSATNKGTGSAVNKGTDNVTDNVADIPLRTTGKRGGAGNLVLWRHGQTDHNLELRLQGQIDIPLNDTGRAQAAAAAGELADGVRAHRATDVRIVSSDLSRATDTAAALAEHLGVLVETDAGLRERAFGLWEGMTHAEVKAGWPERYAGWRAGEDPGVEGSESRVDCAARVGETIARLAADSTDGATLVIVCHGAASALAIQHLLGLDTTEWSIMRGQDNCHWAELIANQRPFPNWVLATYNRGAAGAPSGIVPGRVTA